MSSARPIEIVTIYNVAHTPTAHLRIRVLSLLSLVVAAVWLYETQGAVRLEWFPKFQGSSTVFNWLGVRLGAAILSAGSVGMESPEAQQNPWVKSGLVPPATTANGPTRKEMTARAEAARQRSAILFIARDAWMWVARVAGAGLAVAGLLGLIGRHFVLRLFRWAAYLILLSTLVSVAAVFVAIHWGGMPPDADLPLYLKVAGIQSAYAWVLLLAVRALR